MSLGETLARCLCVLLLFILPIGSIKAIQDSYLFIMIILLLHIVLIREALCLKKS